MYEIMKSVIMFGRYELADMLKKIDTVCVDTMKWAKAAGVRAVKTMVQTAVATIGTAAGIPEAAEQFVENGRKLTVSMM